MDIRNFLNKVNAYILNPLLEVLFAVAFIYFIYSIIQLVQAEGDKKNDARKAVTWSIVGMFIMISVYGIINVVVKTFGINPNNATIYLDTHP